MKNVKEELTKNINKDSDSNRILCTHCKRTKNNGVKCIGMCVADNEY